MIIYSLNSQELKASTDPNFINISKETGAIVNGNKNRELSNEEYLNRDYYQGRFISRTVDKKEIFNWDQDVKNTDILHAK